MKTVRDVMCADTEVLRATETAAEAAKYLATHDTDTVPVCLGDGHLVGTVRTRDILTEVLAKGRDPLQVTLAELAEQGSAVALEIDSPVEMAAAIMDDHAAARLPVVEGERVVGVATRRDVVRATVLLPWWEAG